MSRHRRPAARRDARRQRFAQDPSSNARSALVSAFNDMEARAEKQRLEEILSKQVGVDDTCSVSQEFLLKAPFIADGKDVALGSDLEKADVDYHIRYSIPLYSNRQEGIILYR